MGTNESTLGSQFEWSVNTFKYIYQKSLIYGKYPVCLSDWVLLLLYVDQKQYRFDIRLYAHRQKVEGVFGAKDEDFSQPSFVVIIRHESQPLAKGLRDVNV